MGKLIFLEDAIAAVMNTEAVFDTETSEPYQKTRDVTQALHNLPTIEASEDCISREWVKGICENMLDEEMLGYMLGHIEDAPSVTTEQSSKVGEWQITDAYPHNVYCSECHKKFAQTHWAVWEDGSLPRNYCPNCGAKMKGADDVLEGDR